MQRKHVFSRTRIRESAKHHLCHRLCCPAKEKVRQLENARAGAKPETHTHTRITRAKLARTRTRTRTHAPTRARARSHPAGHPIYRAIRQAAQPAASRRRAAPHGEISACEACACPEKCVLIISSRCVLVFVVDCDCVCVCLFC